MPGLPACEDSVVARDAGIVLAGGTSSRMGRDKAAMAWGETSLLRQVSDVLAEAVDGPVVVVRAVGQQLPGLAAGVETVADPHPQRGPVEGLAAGLRAVAGRADLAFVAATDLPFLHPALVRRLLTELRDHPEADVVAPVADGHPQLLAAAYRTTCEPAVTRALASGERRLRTVVATLSTRLLTAEELLADPAVLAGDPDLSSFTNVNDPGQYARARARSRG